MKEEIINELDKKLPVVERVHGENHPELHEVLKLYNEIKSSNSKEAILKLREVTSNYAIPDDVCTTFERTYNLLKELDKILS